MNYTPKIGDIVKFNRPGARRKYEVLYADYYGNYEGKHFHVRIEDNETLTTYKPEDLSYCLRATNFQTNPKGSQASSIKAGDFIPTNAKVKIPEPEWKPIVGEQVTVSHLNFNSEDVVTAVAFERGRWNLKLKKTHPNGGNKKYEAYWDGSNWTSHSYGSALNGFNIYPSTAPKKPLMTILTSVAGVT